MPFRRDPYQDLCKATPRKSQEALPRKIKSTCRKASGFPQGAAAKPRKAGETAMATTKEKILKASELESTEPCLTVGLPPPYEFDTLALQAGTPADPTTGAMLTPIYQTTTYRQEAVGQDKGFTYSRSGNPTVSGLERRLAALEGAEFCTCYATGMAATTALCLALLRAGDRVVCSQAVYGGPVRLFQQVLAPFRVQADFVDTSDEQVLADALDAPTRFVFIETPANPTLKLTDIRVAARLSKEADALLIVDNTLLTPALQRPFDLDADVVLHSTTKFIEGHNATVGGALITRDARLHESFTFVRNAIGAIQSPFPAWLTLQGIKTLPLRMARHSENALRIALAECSRTGDVSSVINKLNFQQAIETLETSRKFSRASFRLQR